MIKNIILTLLFCIFCLTANAQRKVPFNGLLLDGSGKPVKNARVYTKNPKIYTLTTPEGRFGLTDVSADDTLVIVIKKRLYYIPASGRKSIIINLVDEMNITSREDAELIHQGYGFVSRREYTGVSNFISGDELRKSGYQNVISALQGRIPGLNITGSNNTFSSGEQNISIRGTRSFMASSTPVFILNNMKVTSFEGINLNDVDYVEVLKDASIYGSEGANGAIIVYTKMK